MPLGLTARVLAAAATVLLALPVLAQTVTDGDTIKLNGTSYEIRKDADYRGLGAGMWLGR